MNKLYFILALGISSVVSTVLAAQATPAPVAALSTNQQAVKKIFDELEKVANSSASGNSAESQLITIYKSHTDHNTLWDQVFPKAAADPSKYLEVKTAFESFNARLFS
ncbi:MAG TPA: hypothetical protein VI959_03470, partial [Alphaproteobacteria bacterium]|nr:hypothetical protein [Alphaproteobacteria bacterium]